MQKESKTTNASVLQQTELPSKSLFSSNPIPQLILPSSLISNIPPEASPSSRYSFSPQLLTIFQFLQQAALDTPQPLFKEDIDVQWEIQEKKLTTCFSKEPYFGFQGTRYVFKIKALSKCHLALIVKGCGMPEVPGRLFLGVRPGSRKDLATSETRPPITALLCLYRTQGCDFVIFSRASKFENELTETEIEFRIINIPSEVRTPVNNKHEIISYNCDYDDCWKISDELMTERRHSPGSEVCEPFFIEGACRLKNR